MIEIFVINSFLIASAVLIHYEALYRLTQLNSKLTFLRPQLRIVMGVFGALTAHVIEVWLFAFAYYFMEKSGRYGELEGNYGGSVMDASYFSFTTYTSLGFGDVVPLGDLRFLVGLEALTGLVMITWTASFIFIEMQRFWKIKR